MPIIDVVVVIDIRQSLLLALSISHGSQAAPTPTIFQYTTAEQNRTNTLKDFLVR
jgi:hypothetical protein